MADTEEEEEEDSIGEIVLSNGDTLELPRNTLVRIAFNDIPISNSSQNPNANGNRNRNREEHVE